MSQPGKKYHAGCVTATLIMLFSVAPIVCGAELVSATGDQRVLTSAQRRLRERVTFTCRDLPIDTVLMQLAEQANVDIIKSPKVTGNVTVKITDVPLDEALNNILAAHSWTYLASENMIRVMPLSEVDVIREKPVTSIYQITYADVKTVATALKDFVSSDGKIAYNQGTSHIIVTDNESKIQAIDRFIAQIDRETSQVMVEARIYDIIVNDTFDMGVEWYGGRNNPLTEVKHTTTDLTSDNFTSQSSSDAPIPTPDADMPSYNGEPYTYGREITEAKDTINDASGTVDESIWTITPDHTARTITGTDSTSTEDMSWFVDPTTNERLPYRKSDPFVGARFSQDEGGVFRFGLFKDMVALDVALSLMRSQVEAKLLANPRILVLDNETANFKIVREVPYTESIQSVGAGVGTIATIEFKDVGVLLQVTPHIARNGMIRLNLKPEFGVQASQTEIQAGSVGGAPQVDTRVLETTALVKDGQTVVMGGLRKRETTTDVTKVPVLGDLPLLGNLFRYESEDEVTNELVIFITPTIMTGTVLSETEMKQLEATNFPSRETSKVETLPDNQS
jgi:type II secretory pathway component GspD/PulD (secretin)